jgi:chemotaxis protein CheD
MPDPRKVKVKIADLAVGSSPSILVTYGLGSCVAVMLYDPVSKIGGMNHFLLPTTQVGGRDDNPAKFSDMGIPLLIQRIKERGAKKERLVAKVVGGANMFPSLTKNSIGKKNVDAAHEVLEANGIAVIASDTGGNWGRSIEFDLDTGVVTVRSYKEGDREI